MISYVPVPASAYTGAECAGGGYPPAESGVLPSPSPEVRTPDAAERGPGAGMFFTWSSVNLPELPHDINDQAQSFAWNK